MTNLDVTTNLDAQEAESRKYYAWNILKLESGKFALWSSDRKLVGIYTNPQIDQCVFVPPSERIEKFDTDLLRKLGLEND